MSTQPDTVRAELWPGKEIEGVEVQREHLPSYNDMDHDEVVVETEDGTQWRVRDEQVVEEP